MARVVAGWLLAVGLIVAGAWTDLRPVGGDAPNRIAAQTTTAAQDEFVPIDELPPEDRLPAAPFLVAAYTITLLLLVGYVWLLWRRLALVQRELHEARGRRSPRAGG